MARLFPVRDKEYLHLWRDAMSKTEPGRFHPLTENPPSTLDREAFVETYGGVYEHSPWIARRVFDQGLSAGHDTAEGLAGAMARAVESAGGEAQLALLRAHPDLAGKLGVGEILSEASGLEQAGSGLDRCTADEFARFQQCNDAYKARFGFPFILAVRGHDRGRILEIFQRRLENGVEEERTEALRQVHRIALLRLRDIP